VIKKVCSIEAAIFAAVADLIAAWETDERAVGEAA